MSKYTGCQCSICQNAFGDEDDIVVCPECGTPYHRSCYESAGQCINTSLHAVGGSWQALQDDRRKRLGGTECPSCHHINLPDADTCSACGTPLTSQDAQNGAPHVRIAGPDGRQYSFPITDPCCGMSPDEDYEGERLGDIASFVRSNTMYYIPLFHRFRDTGRKISVNLPCILFPYYYFAHRKMWLMAILTALVTVLCNLPNYLLQMLTALTTDGFVESLQSMWSADITPTITGMTSFLSAHQDLLSDLRYVMPAVSLVINLLLCLFGNYLYYRFVLRAVRRIRKTAPTPSIRAVLLVSEGGTNIWNILGCFFIYQAMPILICTILLPFFI